MNESIEDRKARHQRWIQLYLTKLSRDAAELYPKHGRGFFAVLSGAPSSAIYETKAPDEKVAEMVRAYDPETQIVVVMLLDPDQPGLAYTVNMPTGDDIENDAVRILRLQDEEDGADIAKLIAAHPDWPDARVAEQLQSENMLRDLDHLLGLIASVRRKPENSGGGMI